MLRLYDYPSSGNGYKVRLLLSHLGIQFQRVDLDILAGETRTPEFLAKNPNGKIPALELEDGTVLAESNAILCYLADGTAYLPDDRLARAQTLQWLFFEQYSHEPNVAVARFWLMHPPEDGLSEARLAELAKRQDQGRAALAVMERHLADHRYFVSGRCTVADIALYAYTHVADEGGISLDGYPSIRAWLDRVAAEPGHIPITQA